MLIYCLFTCDEWKSRSSMRLLYVTTDPSDLDETIAHEIKLGNIEYLGCDSEEGEQAFLRDKNYDMLEYATVMIAEDGSYV